MKKIVSLWFPPPFPSIFFFFFFFLVEHALSVNVEVIKNAAAILK
jgi:hypothetical protein